MTGEAEAARRLDGHRNRWFLDPVLRGGYPADLVELYEERVGPLEFVLPGDLEEIAAPIDFLGVNFYQPAVVRPSSADGPLALEQVPWDGPRTAMGWTVEPSSLTELLLRLKRDYGDVPLVITENGASYDDPELDGQAVIEDPQRVAFIRGHVEAVERAVAAGVDVRGYYVWSLLDNFEWEHGYDRRFGIVAVNFENLEADAEAQRALVPRPDRATRGRELRWRTSRCERSRRSSRAARSRSTASTWRSSIASCSCSSAPRARARRPSCA